MRNFERIYFGLDSSKLVPDTILKCPPQLRTNRVRVQRSGTKKSPSPHAFLIPLNLHLLHSLLSQQQGPPRQRVQPGALTTLRPGHISRWVHEGADELPQVDVQKVGDEFEVRIERKLQFFYCNPFWTGDTA